MAYAIANFIYGVPLSEAARVWYECNDSAIKDIFTNFTKLYSDYNHASAYCGEHLYKTSEVEDAISFRDLTLNVFCAITEEMRISAQNKYDTLPLEVKALLPPLGIYLIWSSS